VGEYRFVEPMARVRFSPVALSNLTPLRKVLDIKNRRFLDLSKILFSKETPNKSYSAELNRTKFSNFIGDTNGGLNMDRVKLTGSIHCSSKE
jgi:hypothetical protein